MHRESIEEPVGDDLGAFSPKAEQRRGGDLDETSLFGPFQDALRRLLQDGISLGMGQDGRKAAVAEAGEALGKLCWNTEVAQLDQQIIRLANGVGVRLLEDALQIFEGEMKIAAQSYLQLNRRANFLSKLAQQPRKIPAIVSVTVIGVRGSYRVNDTVGRRHAAHFDGYFPGFGAVVDFGKNVAVDVDHEAFFT